MLMLLTYYVLTNLTYRLGVHLSLDSMLCDVWPGLEIQDYVLLLQWPGRSYV